jgi:tetratricopeptide (TPR) repeat protein
MRKNNLNKSRNGNGRDAAGKQKRRLIPSKKVGSVKKTSLAKSADQTSLPKNSTWTETLARNAQLGAEINHAIRLKLKGQFEAAIKLLNGILRRFPGFAPACWYLAGILQNDLKQTRLALPYFRKAMRLAPKSERASLGLFHALWDLGRCREAMKELQRFQSVGHCKDYEEILAEVREKAPDLLGATFKPNMS